MSWMHSWINCRQIWSGTVCEPRDWNLKCTNWPQDPDLLRTHCASIRIRLFDPFKFGDKSESLGPTHLRCQTIWDCLQSTHELYDAFRLVPAESVTSLTVISILHIALAIIKASRLLCVEDRAWDLNTARTMYNFPGILQQLSKVFEDASSGGSPRSKVIVHGLPVFSEYAEAYRGIERLYLDRLNSNVVLSNPSFMDPINASNGDDGLDFWKQLSDLTNGVFPWIQLNCFLDSYSEVKYERQESKKLPHC